MAPKHTAMPYGELPAPDVVDYLVGQHSRIRDLMLEVMQSSGDVRKEAFRELVRLLSVHETAEEEVVHPAGRVHADSQGVVDDRLDEERAAKELLERLDGMDPDDAEFLPLFMKLREAVLTHAVYEQRYEFNRLRQNSAPGELQAMRALVKAAEGAAPTHPHAGVESVTKNMLLGPPTAIVDRTRDLIRKARGKKG